MNQGRHAPDVLAAGPTASLPKRLPALTGLRGIAALWVALYHFLPEVALRMGHAPPAWIRTGYLGVDLFFILSGFILCYVYADSFRRYTAREYFHFLLVRLARIYPLHAFNLLLLLAIVVALPGFREGSPSMFPPGGFLMSALLLQNVWGQPAIWNVPAWTLSAEWFAYMFFPVFYLATHKVRSARVALIAATLSLACVPLAFAVGGGFSGMGKSGFVRLAGEFTAGCLVHRAYRLGLPGKTPWAALNITVLALLAAIVEGGWGDMLAVLPFGFLILSLVHYEGWVHRFLSGKWVVFLGEISFSVYLGQEILIWTADWYVRRFRVEDSFAYWGVKAVLLISLIGVPYLTWRFVELPARAFGRRLADRWMGKAAERQRCATTGA